MKAEIAIRHELDRQLARYREFLSEPAGDSIAGVIDMLACAIDALHTAHTLAWVLGEDMKDRYGR